MFALGSSSPEQMAGELGRSKIPGNTGFLSHPLSPQRPLSLDDRHILSSSQCGSVMPLVLRGWINSKKVEGIKTSLLPLKPIAARNKKTQMFAMA